MYIPFKSYEHSKKATMLSYFFNILSIFMILSAVIIALSLGKSIGIFQALTVLILIGAAIGIFCWGCGFTDTVAMRELENKRNGIVTKR